jgi:hypothetical protein
MWTETARALDQEMRSEIRQGFTTRSKCTVPMLVEQWKVEDED